MEEDGKTRIFLGGEPPERWVKEIYPENGVRLEGTDAYEVRDRLSAICKELSEGWLVTTVIARAYIGTSFEIGNTGSDEADKLPVLAGELEKKLGASGLTLLISN